MADLFQLWLPILVSAVLVFVASSLIHMVFKWHNSDYRKLANEPAVAAALGASAPAPGLYSLPHCIDMKDMQAPDMQARFRSGPVAMITVRPPGMPAMGALLLQWFVFTLLLATAIAVLVLYTYGRRGNPAAIGHLAGVVAFLAYGAGSIPNAIWMGKPWGTVGKDLLDALIYGAVTGLAFWQLWPD
jgi:hypothetical protein